uniref:Emb2411 (Embryo defective 2411) n=1 Tax=Arundo donax TaxID=35708 RepID=A0A0A9HGH8_ARUDO
MEPLITQMHCTFFPRVFIQQAQNLNRIAITQ